MSPATVSEYLQRAARAGLTWEQAHVLSEAEVEARLFTYIGRSEPLARATVDFEWIHRELRQVGVTLQLLWGEYQHAAQSSGARSYQYSQFCELYAAWRDQRRLSMRQVHRPGEKLFMDYSGKSPCLCDAETGGIREVELFVAVLGASNEPARACFAPCSRAVRGACRRCLRGGWERRRRLQALAVERAAPGWEDGRTRGSTHCRSWCSTRTIWSIRRNAAMRHLRSNRLANCILT
jgi:transposase